MKLEDTNKINKKKKKDKRTGEKLGRLWCVSSGGRWMTVASSFHLSLFSPEGFFVLLEFGLVRLPASR